MAREKRRTARGQVSATVALVQGKRSLGSFRVLNLSVGGALLVGRAPKAKGGFDALVRFSTGRVVRAGATVLREESVHESSVFAIELSKVSQEDMEAIDSHLLTAVEEARDPTAVVIAESMELRHLLRAHLNGLGHVPFDVSSVADAIRLLDAPNMVEVAVVDLGLGADDAQEILGYLRKKHPKIRRLVIEDSAEPASVGPLLRKRVVAKNAIVAVPYKLENLARALGHA